MRKPSYDPVRDFVAIGEVLREPMVLAVRADLPFKSVAELLTYARANPGKLNYGSSGLGGLYHLAMELLCQAARIEMVHVPYLGGGPALLAALSGQVDVIFNVASAQLPHLRSGKLRALAVMNGERLKRLPELPTLAEAGLPGLEAALTLGLMAPKKTPPEVIAQLTEALNFAIADAGYRDKRVEDGAVIPKSTSGEEFDRYLQADRKRWKEVISTMKLSLD
jgi:tripartite-type tricarboxylate transporter receptor subunit TctC